MAVKHLLLLALVVGASAQLNNGLELQQLHQSGFGGVCVADCGSVQCYQYLSACPYYQQRLYFQDACSALNRLPAIVLPAQQCSYLNYIREDGAILKIGGVQCLCRNGDFVQCTPVQSNTVIEILKDDPEVSIFASLLALPEYENVTALLNDTEATLTVFVPNDDAFIALLNATGLDPVADSAAIIAVLQYHVSVLGGFSSRILSAAEGLEMANSEIVTFTRELQQSVLGFTYGPLRVDNATVLTADVIASNGLVHIIDQVLIPEAIPVVGFTLYDVSQTQDEFQVFGAIVDLPAYSDIKDFLMDESTTGTVFVPTNEALILFLQANDLDPTNPIDVPAITTFLNYHILEIEATPANIPQGSTPLATRARSGGVALVVDIFRDDLNGLFKVNGVDILTYTEEATNGIMYLIEEPIPFNAPNPVPVPMG